MQLPEKMRDMLVSELDQYLEAVNADPDSEAVAAYLIELLETYADDKGLDELIADLEDEGALDGSLQTVVEAEMTSNDEFEFTGEEIVSLLERLCDIEWDGEYDADDDDETDDID